MNSEVELRVEGRGYRLQALRARVYCSESACERLAK